MKVCPKCGFSETIPWRQNRWRLEVEFCWLEQFRDFYVDIYSQLSRGIVVVCDEFYAYRLAGKHKNLVERIRKFYYEANGPKVFQKLEYEKDSKKAMVLNQTKLLDDAFPEKEGA